MMLTALPRRIRAKIRELPTVRGLSLISQIKASAVCRVEFYLVYLVGGGIFLICVVLAVARWRAGPLACAGGVVAVMAVCGADCLNCRRRLADTQAVAQAVQRALLRPLPQRLGPLQLETRYLAVASQAQVGGDVYDAVWTPYGIRFMIGDVMGKGLGAVETASRLLGAFREAAYEEERLTWLAWRLQVSLSRSHSVAEPAFATVLLLTLSPQGDVAEMLSCGHPPPLLLRADGSAREIEIGSPCPPLGMLEFCHQHAMADAGICSPGTLEFCDDSAGAAVDLQPGDGLLLYTDGVTEARDTRGRFFPLAECVAHTGPADLMEHLTDALARHTSNRPHDDAAIVLLWRRKQA
jgi:hypothetical protein